jgi:protein phosphatase PTC7
MVCTFFLLHSNNYKIPTGVDPSLFSQALMYFASKHAGASWAGEPDFDPIEEPASPAKSDKCLSPTEIISKAYQNVLNEPAVQCGERN